MGTGNTERVSVDSDGREAHGPSQQPAISGDGQIVVFSSSASNLVPANELQLLTFAPIPGSPLEGYFRLSIGGQVTDDIYFLPVSVSSVAWAIRDALRGLGYEGVQVTLRPGYPPFEFEVSFEGESAGVNQPPLGYVESAREPKLEVDFSAEELRPGDPHGDMNGWDDVFAYDQRTGEIVRVSVSSAGDEGNSNSSEAAVSSDGRFVGFTSYASNLVQRDSNAVNDIFVFDRSSSSTVCISTARDGSQANGTSSGPPSFSADGRYVGFWSSASNLVPDDTNGWGDTFRIDRQTGETQRVSLRWDGTEAKLGGSLASVSVDGRYVALASDSALALGTSTWTSNVFVVDLQNEPRPDAHTFILGANAGGRILFGNMKGDTGAIRGGKFHDVNRNGALGRRRGSTAGVDHLS